MKQGAPVPDGTSNNLGAGASAGEVIIDVQGLSKIYGGRKVVDDFSLSVQKGQIYGFLGPNGSGKTTAIRMICGLLRPDAGSGQCLGHDLLSESAAIKREVGYMTQRFGLYEDLSIAENLEFIARAYSLDRRRERVDQALQHLGLAPRRKQLAGQLSGGWKQRLALAACLLHEPRLLLLDEPTAGVDPKARGDFWDEINQLAADGITVLVSTHYMDEAVRCTRLGYIAYGKLLATGRPSELVAKSGIVTWAVSTADHDETEPDASAHSTLSFSPLSLSTLMAELHGLPGVQTISRFGNSLHISGTDAVALEQSLAPYRARPGLHWHSIAPALEDVFIDLMRQSADNFS